MVTWKKYPKSEKMYRDAKKVFAMGVGSQVQSFARPHPLYIAKAKGSRVYDEDGNEFIDFLLNYGPNILGHSPAVLNRAIRAQLEKGYAFGEPHRLQVIALLLLRKLGHLGFDLRREREHVQACLLAV